MVENELKFLGEPQVSDFGALDVSQEQKEISSRIKQKKTTFASEDFKGIWYSAQDANVIYNIGHYLKYKQGWGEVDDEDFKESFDPFEVGQSRGYNLDEIDELKGAKNKNHLHRLIYGIDERKEKRKFSAEVNTQWQTIVGTLGGAVVDLNIPIAGAAYKTTKVTGSAAKGLATGVALDSVESVLRYATHDNTNAVDVPIDILLSTIFNVGAVRQAGKETDAILRAEAKRTSDAEALGKQKRDTLQQEEDIRQVNQDIIEKAAIKERAYKRLEAQRKQTKENWTKEQEQKKLEEEINKINIEESANRIKREQEEAVKRASELTKKEIEEKQLIEKELELKLKQRQEASTKKAKEAHKKEIDELKKKQDEIDANAKERARVEKEKIQKANELVKKEADELKKINEEIQVKAKQREEAKTKKAKEAHQKELNELTKKKQTIESMAAKRLEEQKIKTKKASEEVIANKKRVSEALEKIESLIQKEEIRVHGKVMSQLGMKEKAIYDNIAEEVNEQVENIKNIIGEKEALKVLEENFKDVNFTITATKGVDGFWSIVKKDAKGVSKKVGKVPLALGAALAGTSAMASEDGVSTYDAINGLLLLAVAGYVGSTAWRGREGLKQYVGLQSDKIKNIYKREENINRNKDVYEEGSTIAEKVRTPLLEAYYAIASVGPEFKKLAGDLLYNFENSVHESAEIVKQRLQRGLGGDYAKKEKEAFDEYIDELVANGDLTWSKTIYGKSELKIQFREKLTDVVESGVESESKALNKAAENFRKLNNDLLALAIHYGVEGADKIKALKNYVPRFWHGNNIKDLLAQTDEAGKAKIIDAFTNAIHAKQTERSRGEVQKVAESLVEWFMVSSYTNIKRSGDETFDDVFDYIKNKYGEADAKELSKVFIKPDERMGRFKQRIDMDLSYLDNIELNVGGVNKVLNKKDFVERNAFNITETYLNQMGGSIGLAKNGWKTEADIDRVIFELSKKNPDAANKLVLAKNLVLGRPVITNPFSKESEIITSIRNIAIATSLPLVAFSTGSELMITVSKAIQTSKAGQQMMKELNNIFKQYDPDDELMVQLSRITGRGNSQILHDNSLRGVSNTENIQEGIGFAEKVTGKLRDGVIKYSQLPKMTDFYERVVSVHYATVLSKWINGEVKISPSRLIQYGMTEDTKKILKDVLKTNEKGNLKVIGELTIEQEQELGKVVNAMVNSNIQHATIGGTPLYFSSTNTGRLFGVLLSFGLNAYSNIGLRGLINKDAETYMTSALWFAGAYLGVKARAQITGAETEEQNVIKKALLNMPLAGPIGLLGAGNAPTLQIISNVSDLLDIYRDN